MELRLGKMTSKELAEWFEVSYSTFRKKENKDKKLQELKEYADFEEVYGGVIISAIKEKKYVKDAKKSKEIILNALDEEWAESGLDTCSNVAIKIYDKHKDELTIADSTAYNYTIAARKELYGVPFQNGGKLGNCIYIWCKKDEDTGTYSFLTKEEQEIKQKLQTKYFGDATEKQILIKGMVEKGEIKKEDAWEVLEEMTNMNTSNFLGFLKELQSTIGCQVVRGTWVRRLGSGKEYEIPAWIENDIQKTSIK